MMFRIAVMAALGLLVVVSASAARAQEFDHRLGELHYACEAGNRGACVKFGILLGRHQEHEAEWRHNHPEWYWYER